MGSITVPIEAQDNVLSCILYGPRQPSSGRHATEGELTNIRQWIRSSQLVEEFLNTSNEINESKIRIVIDLIHGQPITITPFTEETIHLVDSVGVVRIFKQSELRAFLDIL